MLLVLCVGEIVLKLQVIDFLGFVQQELYDVVVASHDCDMQDTGAFGVLLVGNAHWLEQFYYFEVSMVHSIVEAVEALGVTLLHWLPHGTLEQDFANVYAKKIEFELVVGYG